jgi:hypothetical protein
MIPVESSKYILTPASITRETVESMMRFPVTWYGEAAAEIVP